MFDTNEELLFLVEEDRDDRADLMWTMGFEVRPGEEGATI
jgi:hypothetical protein